MKLFFNTYALNQWRQNQNESVGFVPTMGALHEGHLSLVRASKKENSMTLVSVFINPKQFNQQEDYDLYPSDIAKDLEVMAKSGVDAVFIPSVEAMYPKNDKYEVALPGSLAQGFEGDFRPGHFEGVVNVVDRLFFQVQPDAVYFGQKDLQQCLVVSELIKTKYPDIRFRWVSTKRESSGLAMSSRNVRLSSEAREKASMIYKEISSVSNVEPISTVLHESRQRLSSLGFKIEYLDILAWSEMPVEPKSGKAVVFAGYLDGVRLIDNSLLV